jgi:hypothetical protein
MEVPQKSLEDFEVAVCNWFVEALFGAPGGRACRAIDELNEVDNSEMLSENCGA